MFPFWRISIFRILLFTSGSNAGRNLLVPHQQQVPLGPYENAFDWGDVSPSEVLKYTPCHGGLQCARLDVPLNWNASGDGGDRRAAVAVVRVPAKVSVTHPNYGGAILMNPGGPGESGIHQVVAHGRDIQTILDATAPPLEDYDQALQSDAKYFDIIGFDPRGINNTTPHLTCFPDTYNQQTWIWTLPDYAVIWDSDSSISLEWARAKALGRSCAGASDAGIIRYVNTAQVVEDMVEIVERHAEWREAEVERLMDADVKSISAGRKQNIRQQASWKRGEEMLQYWGVSYGSLLGQTFAAMHPTRVERLVMDGVLDPDDYYTSTWLLNLVDTDLIMTKLSEYCFEAGPSKCPLYTGHSGKDVEDRVEKIVFGLKEDPIPVPASGMDSRGPEVVTFGDILLTVLSAMAFPYAWAETAFDVFAQVEKRNVTDIAILKQDRLRSTELSTRCRDGGPFSDACVSDAWVGLLGANQAIECMDSARRRDKDLTKRQFKEYLGNLTGQSKWFGATWARHKYNCVGINEQTPAWTFEGPIEGNTSHPMLIIGNTHDSVTPLRNAHRVSTLFPDSVVLQQNSQGHYSWSNPSICTAKHLRAYFQAGELPDAGTVCEAEYKPFIGCVSKDANGDCERRSEEDEATWVALHGLAMG